MSKTIAALIIAIALLSACAPKPEAIALVVNQTLTANPTSTAYPTYTPYPSLTPENTYTPIIKLVTATFTPTPIYTPTETSTPTITPTMTATIDKQKAPHNSGFYLLGVTIAPGVWLSNGTGDGCYWAVTRKDGGIIDNHFGMAGGTAYIPSYGFQVQFEDCGTWTWLSP